MRRILLLTTLAAMFVAAMALFSGVALAQQDVCVSIKGETKVDEGPSFCSSDSTSQAVAVKGSFASASGGSTAKAIQGSTAFALINSDATAINGSCAAAENNREAMAKNGEHISNSVSLGCD